MPTVVLHLFRPRTSALENAFGYGVYYIIRALAQVMISNLDQKHKSSFRASGFFDQAPSFLIRHPRSSVSTLSKFSMPHPRRLWLLSGSFRRDSTCVTLQVERPRLHFLPRVPHKLPDLPSFEPPKEPKSVPVMRPCGLITGETG